MAVGRSLNSTTTFRSRALPSIVSNFPPRTMKFAPNFGERGAGRRQIFGISLLVPDRDAYNPIGLRHSRSPSVFPDRGWQTIACAAVFTRRERSCKMNNYDTIDLMER